MKPLRWIVTCALVSWVSLVGATSSAQEAETVDSEPGPRLTFGFEAKAHFRSSDESSFRSPFFVPPSPPVFFTTVDPEDHFEVSTLTLFADATWGESVAAHAKIDIIDLYDRNPTSEDKEIDVDEVWLRFGRETDPAMVPTRPGMYLKVGKFAKFERQDDRHLESYGLVSTAFNRFEDAGVELGVDLGRYFYLKASATQGNPVFLRDPNALAGDNGTSGRTTPGPGTDLGSGIVLFYDAEVEDLDTDGKLETGAGLGFRLGDETGERGLDLLVWSYRRQLAPRVALKGTFYGGDLDLLDGPSGVERPAKLEGDDKEEVGANLWLYHRGLTFFGQYVDQDLAGLPRVGYEGELAYSLELPLKWAVAGQQLFSFIQPAVRYSKLDNDWVNHPRTPSPSTHWDWEKLDYGVRIGILNGVDLTLEYADHEFITARGPASNNEFLTTLRWAM